MKRVLVFLIHFYFLLPVIYAQPGWDDISTLYVTVGGIGDGHSWSTSTNLDDALVTAQTNLSITEIWIKGGNYKPKYDKTGVIPAAMSNRIYFVKSGLRLYGSLKGTETIIGNNGNYAIAATDTTYFDGSEPSFSDYAQNIVLLNNAEAGTLLNGIVIMNGRTGMGAGLQNDGSSGGNSTVSVSNCIFRNNRSSNVVGGGVVNNGNNGYASITFTNCSFVNNQAIGMHGGAIANQGNSGKAYATFINCIFISNRTDKKGGAIFNSGNGGLADARFNNCQFIFNQTTNDKAGVIYNGGQGGNVTAGFTNCLFYANRGNLGVNISLSDCSSGGITNVNLMNCTIYERTSSSGNEMFSHYNAAFGGTAITSIFNSILWKGNGYSFSAASVYTPQTAFGYTSTFNFKNDVIQGIAPGVPFYNSTTYNFYPRFLDTANVDLRLQMCSPAAEAGDNSLYGSTLSSNNDLAGKQRLVNTQIDLGAYESPYLKPLITKEPRNTIICLNKDTTFSLNASGDSLLYQWQVKAPQGSFMNVTNAIYNTLSIVSPDTAMNGWQYRAIVRNCISADTSTVVTLTIKTKPNIALLSNVNACSGDTLHLNANGFSDSSIVYNWIGPNGFAASGKSIFITPANSTKAGLYRLLTNNGYCSRTDSALVTIDTPLVFSVIAANALCAGKMLQLDVSDTISTNTYAWAGPAGFSSTLKNPAILSVSPSNSGTYTVNVKGKNSCKNSASKTITVFALPLGAVKKY